MVVGGGRGRKNNGANVELLARNVNEMVVVVVRAGEGDGRVCEAGYDVYCMSTAGQQ